MNAKARCSRADDRARAAPPRRRDVHGPLAMARVVFAAAIAENPGSRFKPTLVLVVFALVLRRFIVPMRKSTALPQTASVWSTVGNHFLDRHPNCRLKTHTEPQTIGPKGNPRFPDRTISTSRTWS